jgi:hypothetical protein
VCRAAPLAPRTLLARLDALTLLARLDGLTL